MNKKIRWICETALMLAVLVAAQALTKPLGQLVTGSCVNTVLAVTALVAGWRSGITVALISPVMAFLLGIAPQILTVPVIMAGNAAFVAVLWLLAAAREAALWRRLTAWLSAAAVKFCLMYAAVRWLICGLLAPALLEGGLLKQPMLQALPITFGWPQLVTALIGGGIGLLLTPLLKRALKR